MLSAVRERKHVRLITTRRKTKKSHAELELHGLRASLEALVGSLDTETGIRSPCRPGYPARSAMPRPLLLYLLPLLLTSCTLLGDDGDRRSELERRRQQWERQGIDSYEYELNIACFCPYFGPVQITVRADTVAALAFDPPPDLPPPTEAQSAFYDRTVDDLFDVIERAFRQGADDLEVEYHDALGYPTRISIDYYENALDDEIGYTVYSLTPLR